MPGETHVMLLSLCASSLCGTVISLTLHIGYPGVAKVLVCASLQMARRWESSEKPPPGPILCAFFPLTPFLCVPGYSVGKRIGMKQEGSKLGGKGRRRVGGFVFAFMR